MKTLAYIPGLQVPADLDGSVSCFPARFWEGKIEACEAISVHPHVKAAPAIIAAYRAAGVPVVDWDKLGRVEQKPVEITGLRDNMWAGEDVVIVGGGPSLKGFDFHRLNDFPCKVIAINRAYEFLDRFDLFFAMDGPYIDRCETGAFGPDVLDKWRAVDALMVTATLEARESAYHRLIWLPRGSANHLSANLKGGIHTGRNSGFGALHLAMLLGARRVFLLGYDCSPTEDGKTAHFHDGYPEVKNDRDEVYKRFIPAFDQHGETIKKRCEVINCNPDSAIRAFDFGDLPDGPLRPRAEDVPVVACYVTPDYQKVFDQHLLPGLKAHGLRYELVKLSGVGNWKQNACQKPTAIQRVRAAHPGQPIIWLDADAEIHRIPSLFGALTGRHVDLGVHYLPSGEMLNSAIYLGASGIVDVLIEDWAARCQTAPERYGTADQRHLQDAIEVNDELHIERLPASYCKIFDRAEQIAAFPVITQHQASRAARRGKKRGNR